MASRYYHRPRKLLKVTASPSIPKSCKNPCDSHKNTLGSCPISCVGLCSDVCKYSQPISSVIRKAPAPVVVAHGPSSQYNDHSSYLSRNLIIFIAVFIASFLALIVYATFKLYKKRRRRSSVAEDDNDQQDPNDNGDDEFIISDDEDEDEDYGPVLDHPIWYIRTIGLLPSVIGSITVVRYKKGDGLIEGTGCSVCLTEFEDDERVKLLPKCNHAFHIHCVDTWLRSHTNCPLCRAPVMNGASQEIQLVQNVISRDGDDDINTGVEVSSPCNSDDEQVVKMESENDDDETSRSINRRVGFKIVPEHVGDCNNDSDFPGKSVVNNLEQCVIESL